VIKSQTDGNIHGVIEVLTYTARVNVLAGTIKDLTRDRQASQAQLKSEGESMKLGTRRAVRIVKRQNDAAPERRITEACHQVDSLLNVKKTVLSWIHEFENKRIVELQREFSNLFRAEVVAGGSTTSLRVASSIGHQENAQE